MNVLEVLAAGMVASRRSSGEFIEVQFGTPRRYSIGTFDLLAFRSEAPPQSLPIAALPPVGAPGSAGSPYCAPHLPSNHDCHAQVVPHATYELRPRTSPTVPLTPLHAGHTNSPSRRRRDRRRVGRWSDAVLESAKNVVNLGGQIRTIAKLYGIPPSSLVDHINGRTLTRKRGREGVLSAAKEAQLVDYVLKMVELGYPLSLGQLKIKVAKLVQFRPMPFTTGVHGGSWVKWFRRRHLELTFRSSQGLDIAHSRGLCPENVATFYHNLRTMYEEHQYPPSHLWNCDETGVQAGRAGFCKAWFSQCPLYHS
jgi:hypothetical protein